MSRTLDVAAGSAVVWMNSTWSLPMACLSIDLRRLRGESPQILGLPLTIQHYIYNCFSRSSQFHRFWFSSLDFLSLEAFGIKPEEKLPDREGWRPSKSEQFPQHRNCGLSKHEAFYTFLHTVPACSSTPASLCALLHFSRIAECKAKASLRRHRWWIMERCSGSAGLDLFWACTI